MRSHSIGETPLFVDLGEKYDFFGKDLESPLTFIYFRRGKQVRIKPLNGLLIFFGKAVYEKPESGFGDQVTYWEGTVKTVAPL